MGENARAHLIVSGRVQGVCFRAETQQAASRLGLTGWVKNKSDGTVEADVEGDKQALLKLIDWCRKGPPISAVAHVAVTWKDHRDAYDDFSIRY
jgi:acylphosphatase